MIYFDGQATSPAESPKLDMCVSFRLTSNNLSDFRHYIEYVLSNKIMGHSLYENNNRAVSLCQSSNTSSYYYLYSKLSTPTLQYSDVTIIE